MSSQRRRRGIPVKVWKSKVVTDRRGNRTITADLDAPPYMVRASFMQLRGSEAEVPGQLQIRTARITVDIDVEDVSLWTVVECLGELWDVATPPSYHHGTRNHTRHWTIELRQRGI